MVILPQDLITGHHEIDEQHRNLFRLTEALKECARTEDRENAKCLFQEFLDHVINHFTFEESLMRKVKYPEALIRSHSLSHRTLQEIYLVAYKPAVSGVLSIYNILELFESHFVAHLIEEDRKLASFVQEHRLLN